MDLLQLYKYKFQSQHLSTIKMGLLILLSCQVMNTMSCLLHNCTYCIPGLLELLLLLVKI